MAAKKYTVRYELDEDGWWVATVVGAAGVHTQGRTVGKARERIEEAMQAAVEHAFELVDAVKLPKEVQRAIDIAREKRVEADNSSRQAQLALKSAAKVLTKSAGMGMRAAAEQLGISYQRIHQLVNEP